MQQEPNPIVHDHRHEGFSHSHDLDEGLVAGAYKTPRESRDVPIHTRFSLLHFAVRCDCGYHGEIDTYGEYGYWWKWFIHVHAQEGHHFTIAGEPVFFRAVLDGTSVVDEDDDAD
jgi:hypothetical protein